MVKKVISFFENQPHYIFLLDACGAMLTILFLAGVLSKLEFVFGIPANTLYLLSAIPVIFICFDAYAYFEKSKNLASNLKIIATMNLIYCAISFGFALYHYKEIKIFGWLYVVNEIIIIAIISSFEFKVGKKHLRT